MEKGESAKVGQRTRWAVGCGETLTLRCPPLPRSTQQHSAWLRMQCRRGRVEEGEAESKLHLAASDDDTVKHRQSTRHKWRHTFRGLGAIGCVPGPRRDGSRVLPIGPCTGTRRPTGIGGMGIRAWLYTNGMRGLDATADLLLLSTASAIKRAGLYTGSQLRRRWTDCLHVVLVVASPPASHC